MRDDEIKKEMFNSIIAKLDLWDDELYENPYKAPLYLIELEKESDILDFIIKKHENNIVTYYHSEHSLADLQRYYSKFTFPYIEMPARGYKETPRGIFGFYDPKVLPDYIKTLYCLEKRQQFFAGISVCFSPCSVKNSLCYEYYLDEQGVVSNEYNMLESLNLENIESSENNIYQPYTLSAKEITIDKKQVSILEDLSHQGFN